MSLPFAFLDQRSIVVAIAGSNGTGKSTFFETFLSDCGLRFIKPDVIAEGLQITDTKRPNWQRRFDLRS